MYWSYSRYVKYPWHFPDFRHFPYGYLIATKRRLNWHWIKISCIRYMHVGQSLQMLVFTEKKRNQLIVASAKVWDGYPVYKQANDADSRWKSSVKGLRSSRKKLSTSGSLKQFKSQLAERKTKKMRISRKKSVSGVQCPEMTIKESEESFAYDNLNDADKEMTIWCTYSEDSATARVAPLIQRHCHLDDNEKYDAGCVLSVMQKTVCGCNFFIYQWFNCQSANLFLHMMNWICYKLNLIGLSWPDSWRSLS